MTCGISSWPDIDALYERLAALLDAPMRPLPRDRMAEVLAYFEEKCAGSKRLAAHRFYRREGLEEVALHFSIPLGDSVKWKEP